MGGPVHDASISNNAAMVRQSVLKQENSESNQVVKAESSSVQKHSRVLADVDQQMQEGEDGDTGVPIRGDSAMQQQQNEEQKSREEDDEAEGEEGAEGEASGQKAAAGAGVDDEREQR